MSAEVETMFSGQGITPWHRMGPVIEGKLRADEARVVAELDWEVNLAPVYVMTDDGMIEQEDRKATVRDRDQKVLGLVSSTYEVIQNEQMFDYVEALLDTDEANFVTAGSLRGGKLVWATLELDQKLLDIPGDEVWPYLTTVSSHDGSNAWKTFLTGTRVVCKNTLDLAMATRGATWSVRHTVNADRRMEEARRTLKLTIGQMDEFSKQAHKMIDQTITEKQFDNLVKRVMPLPAEATDRQKANAEQKTETLRTIWGSDRIGHFHGTAWGAMNAFNEYELWHRGEVGASAESHAIRAIHHMFPITTKAYKELVKVR
jgi:phage/plasmid-like protein (TIGR03299 family)